MPDTRVRLASRTYWDSNWRGAERNLQVALAFGRLDIAARELEHQLQHAGRCAGSGRIRIVEVGCGGGRWLARLAAGGNCHAHGVDYSEEGCTQAKSALQSVGAIDAIVITDDAFADAERQPDAFDLVYSLGFVEHFDSVEVPLRMHMRFARPGGLIFTSVP
jgi:2-polyprenyl-3-methyl-5-hydroxy-6-metoxy-1,4-benzoquinol methylase